MALAIGHKLHPLQNYSLLGFQSKVKYFFFDNLIVIMENERFEPYISHRDDIFCPSITMTRIIGSLVIGWCTLIHLMEVTNGRNERYIYYH